MGDGLLRRSRVGDGLLRRSRVGDGLLRRSRVGDGLLRRSRVGDGLLLDCRSFRVSNTTPAPLRGLSLSRSRSRSAWSSRAGVSTFCFRLLAASESDDSPSLLLPLLLLPLSSPLSFLCFLLCFLCFLLCFFLCFFLGSFFLCFLLSFESFLLSFLCAGLSPLLDTPGTVPSPPPPPPPPVIQAGRVATAPRPRPCVGAAWPPRPPFTGGACMPSPNARNHP